MVWSPKQQWFPCPERAKTITIYPVILSFSFHSPQSRCLSYLFNSNLSRTQKTVSQVLLNIPHSAYSSTHYPCNQLVITQTGATKQSVEGKQMKGNEETWKQRPQRWTYNNTIMLLSLVLPLAYIQFSLSLSLPQEEQIITPFCVLWTYRRVVV